MPLPEIPGYAVERLLGEGASCAVYLARETGGLQRPVALKVFAGGKAEAYAREVAMVRRIEEIRRRERAAEIVQALDSAELSDLSFIAFEILEQGSLMDRVQGEGPLELDTALEWVRAVGRALVLLHGEGIFHRDVKPANLLLGSDGGVRLADFGLSRPLKGTLSAAGSPAFAAPEVIADRVSDGRLVDVYSLAATLAFLLTGETMLPGRPDVFALERRAVPRALQQVLVEATAADPGERTASVERFLEQLDQAAACSESAPVQEPLPAAAPGAETDRWASRLQGEPAQGLIEKCGYAAAALTLLPLPGTELVGVLSIHVAMVCELARLHGVPLSRDGAARLVARIGAVVGLSILGSRVAATAAKLLFPGLGGIVGAPFMYASTLAIGAVASACFERPELSDEEIKVLYRRHLKQARKDFDPRRARSKEARSLAEGAHETGQQAAQSPLEGRLAKLESLLERGLIEAEEYEQVRQRILSETE